jgi:hypothetical protein
MSDEPINQSEAFVLEMCQRSFLSPWCYNNPKGKDGDELCDILVVCDPHVIIVSVKEVLLNDSKDQATSHERWQRKAVDASVKQIYGAERWLTSASEVIRKDGSPGWKLPSLDVRKMHRIAVAFGGRGEVPISSGDLGKGHVHVMTEDGFMQILKELDTITDLVEYLEATESCVARGCGLLLQGSESDLMGWYLFNDRQFPPEADMIIVNEGIWEEVQQKPEFRRRKDADKPSYFWDRLIEVLADPNAKPVGEPGPKLSDVELALRVLARESRFSRRGLGEGIREFVTLAKSGKLRSRILRGMGGAIYVFVFFGHGEEDEYRRGELLSRCFIARSDVGEGDTIIGIGISKYIEGKGSASDLIYFKLPGWSPADDQKAARMKQELGFFKGATLRRTHQEEFPGE